VVNVRVWQHPDEVGHAKGSVPLLRLSLARCDLHVGEPDAALPQGWLVPGAALLYPLRDGPDDVAKAAPGGIAGAGMPPVGAPITSLIALDGTWRQSRLMLRTQPALAALPRVGVPAALLAAHGQRYQVRKAQRPGQLSTLEAVALALGHMEQAPERYAPVLAAFDAWVTGLMRWRVGDAS
jgi:DTW domain-containing protein YfiP